MKLSNLRIERQNENSTLIADVETVSFGKIGGGGKHTIWIKVPSEYENWLTDDRYDGFLVILSYVAMAYGEDIEIDGAVSKRLLRNLNTCVQDIFLAYNSELQRISIKAKETSSGIFPAAAHTGTGFSGGVDSFSTIYGNYVLENDPEYKIDTLFCFNSGTHGRYYDENTEKLFQSRYNFLRGFPDTVNLPYIPVNSNIHYFRDMGGKTLVTGDLNLPTVILCFQKMLKKYYIASMGWNYDAWIDEAGKYRLAEAPPERRAITFIQEFAEPYLYPLLSTETTELILDGMQYSRVQKTLNISEYHLTRQFLNVCLVNEPPKKNCGVCSKCARVGLTLQAVNKLDDYKDVFDIEAYRKKEYFLKCNAIKQYNTDPFMADIVDFSKLHGKKYPNRFTAVLVCFIYKIFDFVCKYSPNRIIKGLARRFFNAVKRLIKRISPRLFKAAKRFLISPEKQRGKDAQL